MTAAEMKKLIAAIFVKKGMYAVEAETVAQRMIDADIIGRSEFGCRSLPDSVSSIDMGDIDPRAICFTKSETPATAWLDANEAMGHLSASRGTDLAIGKAREVGIGAVLISNSQNLGSPLVYARLVAQEGMIGCCLTTPPSAPEEEAQLATQTSFGRQPAAFAVPAEEATIGYEFSFGEHLPLRHQIPSELSGSLGFLHSLLTSGLAGAKTPPEKTRGPLLERFEHFIVAIDSETFAGPDKLATVVKKLSRRVESEEGSVNAHPAIREQEFSVDESTLNELKELAEKLKVKLD